MVPIEGILARAAVAAALILSGTAGAWAQDASLLMSKAADREEKLVAAAKAEGGLTLYTSIAQSDIAPLLNAFHAKYGIDVEVWRASGDTILHRIIEEQRAGRYDVDSVHVSASELEILQREALLQPVASPDIPDLIPGSVPGHGEWISTLYSLWVQAYNTNLLDGGTLPKHYQDLLDPQWQDKLGIEIEDVDWFAAVIKSMGEDKGVDYFKTLKAGNGVSVRKGHSLLNNLVIAGEVPLGLTLYNYMPAQAKEKGAPVNWFTIQPAFARANGIAVTRNARHPNAAALFTDFMLEDGQAILASLGYVPSSTKVASPAAGVPFEIVDPLEMVDHREKWDGLFQDILVRH